MNATNTPTPDVAAVLMALNAHINGIMLHASYKPITFDEQRAIGKRREAIEAAARDACVRYAIAVLETVDGAATGDRSPCEVCEAIAELKALAGEPSS